MILGIYGAGGLGREVLFIAKRINEASGRWSDIFFIDDAPAVEQVAGHSVKRYPDAVAMRPGIEITIGIGEPSIRAVLSERIRSDGIGLATLVAPDVYIPESTRLGAGTVICHGASISCDITMGESVYVQPNAVIGHDVTIGDFSVISPLVSIAGACRIGEKVYIGMNAAVREKISVGDGSIVGMCAAVFSDVPESVTVLGNPGRVIERNAGKRVFRH